MRLRTLSTVALTLAGSVSASVSVSAHPNYHYAGGCRLAASPDANGTTWSGQVALAVTATADDGVTPVLAAISAECALRVDGVDIGVVLGASGTGSAAGSTATSFSAGPHATVEVCEHVEVMGEFHVACHAGLPAAVPADGFVSVKDVGTGPTLATSYDPALWTCGLTTVGSPPTEVRATCTPSPAVPFTCSLMMLSTWAAGTAAGGRVSCNAGPTLDTGVVTNGANTVRGHLGEVQAIVCTAYAPPGGTLAPRYKVTCLDPGPPAA